ncbi:MAG TPA: glycosyltransferase family 2 protein [Oligoflexia bacterium]|nr:glycosyltransferase family 2 protein [Oligoflexia bacterium]HMP47619.1 glycosyltransferase family 2 protein [Oligoflexia bacterium]
MSSGNTNSNTISIIIPFFNEEKSLPILIQEICDTLGDYSLNLILINDGSTDKSEETLISIFKNNNYKNISFKLVTLSRNFGHQIAIIAGLHESTKISDYFAVIDSDLQDNPADIACMVREIDKGYDCVYAVRKANSQNILINLFTDLFYYLQNKISRLHVPKNAGTFSVFTSRFKEQLLRMSEKEIYFPGIRAYVGLNQKGIPVTRRVRSFELSRVGIIGLVDLALNGVLSFTNFPLRLIFITGLIITVTCSILGVVLFWLRVFSITTIPGVTSVLIAIVALFGIQFMFLGIVGEYLGKLFIESKARPIYFISRIKDF